MKIRVFSENDRDSIVALWDACGISRPWNDPHRDIDRKLAVQPELFFVGEMDGAVIASAMAGYDGHRGSVFYLAVLPDYQKRGYGRMLMGHIENSLQSLGCPKLNIVVRSSNDQVLGFYRALGYLADDVASIGKRLITDL